MNIVKFPGLNVNIKFSKIAFKLFGILIYKYAVCIIVGVIVGLIICKINSEKHNIKFEEILEKFLISFLIGIIGARLYYIIFKFDYYKDDIIQIFNIRDGGLAIYGGLIFGLGALILSFKNNKKECFTFLDCIAPAIAIAQSIGRWGNFFNIEAYGSETTNILRMGIFENNKYIEVHPVFLYESLCTLVIFIILQYMQNNKKFDGQIFFMYLILYSFIRTLLEGLRIDSLLFFGFRVSRLLSIIIFIVSIIIYVKKSRTVPHEK